MVDAVLAGRPQQGLGEPAIAAAADNQQVSPGRLIQQHPRCISLDHPGGDLDSLARVVLLDEPTQGLSPAYVDVVIGYVRRLRERDVTVILVEQSIDVVAAVADTVYLMRDGEIAAEPWPAAITIDTDSGGAAGSPAAVSDLVLQALEAVRPHGHEHVWRPSRPLMSPD